jgi:hypothetical protein
VVVVPLDVEDVDALDDVDDAPLDVDALPPVLPDGVPFGGTLLESSPPHESSCESVTPVPTTATTLLRKVFRSSFMGVLLGTTPAMGKPIIVPTERGDQRQIRAKRPSTARTKPNRACWNVSIF